jgi:DNA-binding SARP family transcriptional activator
MTTLSMARPQDAAVAGETQIALLGGLRVRRDDGSPVDSRDWRTGKTADLLRLLALSAGEPVPRDTLLAALWPAVDRTRAQASLRTAASQIRSVLGRGCLARDAAGLVLCGALVDVHAFRTLVRDARRLITAGEPAAALDAARAADALHRGELSAHDTTSEWVTAERRSLADLHRGMLRDGAAAALTCGLTWEAYELARRAVEADPFSESASRLLMRACADLGETSLALQEYDRCRTRLADELGADPSPATTDLFLTLLRGGRSAVPAQRETATPPPRRETRRPGC